jgi:hypothetical protein
MKKFLLLSVAALMGASAFAEDELIFKYDYNTFTEPSFNSKTQKGSNINAPAWTTVDGANNWSDKTGLVVLTGNLDDVYSPVSQGLSIVDLGGSVGKVLCVNGANSNFVDYVKSTYKVELTAPNMTSFNPWWHINWFSGKDNVPTCNSKDGAAPTDNHIHVKMVFSVYDNTPGQNTCPATIYAVNNQIGVVPKDDATASNTAILTEEFARTYDDDPDELYENEEGNYEWDATKWMSYEFDTWCPAAEQDKDYAPIYVKCEFGNIWGSGNIHTKTLLVKSVEFWAVDGAPTSVNNHQHNMVTYADVFDYTNAAVSDLAVEDSNAPVEVYNLSGVRVNSDNLPAGLYIRRQGNKATKVVVK